MSNTYRLIRPQNRHEWTFDEDGEGEVVDWQGSTAYVSTGKAGSIGGGSVRLEWSDDGEEFANVGDPITILAAKAQTVKIAKGKLRPVLVGSTIPPGSSFRLTVS